MKHLFLLLLLAGCTAPNTSAGTAATDTAAQTDLRPLPEEDYKLFINNGNPYLKEYQEFFAQQLKRYGTNTKGEPLVNFEELKTFIFSNSFSFLGIARFMEETFSTNKPPEWVRGEGIKDNSEYHKYLTAIAEAVAGGYFDCYKNFVHKFSPERNILSKKILKQYIDFCEYGDATSALYAALSLGWHVSNIVTLLDLGANPTNVTSRLYSQLDGVNAIEITDDTNVINYLHFVSKTPIPIDILENAVLDGKEYLVRYYINQGLDVHQQDSVGNTLYFRCLNSSDQSIAIINLLLEQGVNPNITNSRGITPFIAFLATGLVRNANIILQYTDTNILPPGQTNLMEAALWARREFYYGGEDAELSSEVVQFISNLSSGK